jgi:hypothetical protein
MDGRLIIGNARIKKAQMWWFPYTSPKPEIMEKAIVLFHHERKREKIKVAFGLLRSWRLVRSTTSIRSLEKIAGRFFR